MIDLCLALSLFGTIPEGNIPIEAKLGLWEYGYEFRFFADSQKVKKKIVYLLCADRELVDLGKDSDGVNI